MERKIFNFESKILKEETIEKYGYDPDKLGSASAKFVVATCRYCGKHADIRKGFFNKSGSACHKSCKIEEQRLNSPFKNPEIKAKANKVIEEKYGKNRMAIGEKISAAKRLKKYSEKIKRTNRQQYNVENISQPSIQISPQNSETIKKILRTDKIKEKYSSNYSFNIQQIQKEVAEIIQDMGLQVVLNDQKEIAPFKLDVYVPELKFAIEFNESRSNSEAILSEKEAKWKHWNKTKLCEKNNIRLFHIFEHTWRQRKSQILNFIKSILGRNTIKIPARKCELRIENTTKNIKKFIDENHIQGTAQSIKYFNLYYNNELVASMSAFRHHRNNAFKSNEIILSRLCFKDGYNIQGGSSRLFNAFKKWSKENGYNKIISWSDNNISQGHIYRILGFELEEEMGPDYFYWNQKIDKYIAKQSMQKSNTGCPKEITERDWCYQRGFYRIWNSGKKRWIYNL